MILYVDIVDNDIFISLQNYKINVIYHPLVTKFCDFVQKTLPLYKIKI
jgi:hypothetical protein